MNEPANIEGLNAAKVMARALATPSLLMPVWQPPEPAVLSDHLPAYDVLELIGRGGMGAVYRARQKSLDRLVAIKVLPLEASVDEGFAARFQNEARLLAKLHHPTIVAVHDSGETSDGHLYLVMELVEGTDLAQLIRDGKLTPPESLRIAACICDALHYAHERGIIHRDIKPSNILLGGNGEVKVADFGLAKLKSPDDSALPAPTLTGTVMGTPDYMAPEQRSGGTVDQRADIYSLGVLLYEMLTGQVPRGAWQPPSKLVQVDPRADTVVTKAMQTEPAMRYQDAGEVRAAVEAIRQWSERPWWKRVSTQDVGWIGWPFQALIWMMYVGFAIEVIVGLSRGWNEWRHPRPPAVEAPAARYDGPGTITDLLRNLTLPAPGQIGNWHWQGNQVGDVLTIGPGNGQQSNVITLPLEGAERSYTVSFDMRLDREASDGGLIFPVGRSQTGLVLNLQRITGLGFISGKAWNVNETSAPVAFAVGDWNRVHVAVKPAADDAEVRVTLNGTEIIRWHGPQADLTLYRDPRQGWPVEGDHSFGLATYAGGVAFRNVRVTWLGWSQTK